MLVDDHQVIIDGLSILLPTVIDCEIVASALTGRSAVEIIKEIEVDLIIIDLVMPGELDGIGATKKIKEINPNVKILCLSMMSDASSIKAMLDAGANGYTIKNAAGDELRQAIESIESGEIYIHPSLVKYFVEGIKSGSVSKSIIFDDIDIIILESIANGLTTQEIAEIVFRSEETIRSRRKKLLKKFSVTNSAELIAYAIRNRFIE